MNFKTPLHNFFLCAPFASVLQFICNLHKAHYNSTKLYASTPTQSDGDQAANADLFESPRETWKAAARRAFLINDVVVGGGTQSFLSFRLFF